MGELNLHDCLIYLADIIIFPDTFETHISKHDAVFHKCSKTSKLKAYKCEGYIH